MAGEREARHIHIAQLWNDEVEDLIAEGTDIGGIVTKGSLMIAAFWEMSVEFKSRWSLRTTWMLS